MKKLVMLLALAVAFSLSGFAQTSSTSSSGGASPDTAKTSTKKSSKKASSDMADSGAKAGGKSSTVTGCLKSDGTPVTLTNGKYKKGVEVDTSAASSEDWAKHNGHKVQLTGSWEGAGADKKFKATAMKHIAETCTAGGDKASAAGGKKGKKGAADATKSPS